MSLTLLTSTKHHLWLGPNQSSYSKFKFRTVLETLSNPLIFSCSDSNNATDVDSLTAAHDFTFTWPNVVAHPLSDSFAVNGAYWSPIFDPDSPTVNNPIFRTVLETLSNPLIFSYSDSNNATDVDSLTAAHDFTFTWPNVVAHPLSDRTSHASTNEASRSSTVAAANSSSYETAHTAAYGEANVSAYSISHRTADSSAITTTDPNTYTASFSSANESSIHSTNSFSNRISHADSKFWPISKAKFISHASTI